VLSDAADAGGRQRSSRISSIGTDEKRWPGVWVSNTKSRRDKLTDPQRTALTELGLNWG
jgi:hypothetical protein